MPSVLMVALDYPPCRSAGVQRTLKFCEYLPEAGWNPIVLTAKQHIYDAVDNETSLNGASAYPVYRATGLNSFKHISYKGKHIGALSKPDRFFTWYWDAKRLGKKAVERHKPSIIWSTFPCPTAHRIACALKQRYKLPWVADFRDPFAGNNPLIRVDNEPAKRIDEETVKNADLLVFTTRKAADLYLAAYPYLDECKVTVIENGFNEEVFSGVNVAGNTPAKHEFRILHSGALYDNGRDPSGLFEAMGELKAASSGIGKNIKVAFRGVSDAGKYGEAIAAHNLQDHVEFLPAVSYQQSIREMCEADGLLLLQGKMFNNQIPGKVYEYLRAGKPILALADYPGATAELLKPVDHALVADMVNPGDIKDALGKIVDIRVDESFDYTPYSRRYKARQLAECLSVLQDKNNRPG